MDKWELIRLRCVPDKEPIKLVARELGLAPNTVRKYVRTHIPQKMMGWVQMRKALAVFGGGLLVRWEKGWRVSVSWLRHDPRHRSRHGAEQKIRRRR